MIMTVYIGLGGHRQSRGGPSPASSVAVMMLSPEVVPALSVFGQKLLALPVGAFFGVFGVVQRQNKSVKSLME